MPSSLFSSKQRPNKSGYSYIKEVPNFLANRNNTSNISILRTFFEAEAETRIPPLVFASVMMLKPAFHRWRFKIVRTVDIYQLLSLDKPELLKTIAVEPQERVKKMLDISLALAMLSRQLNFSDQEDSPKNTQSATLILSYPYFNPDYKELWKGIINEVKDVEQVKVKQVRYLRLLEQDINTYNYTVESEAVNYEFDPSLVAAVCAIKQRHTIFLDFVGYLHSSFELSPYVRVPARGTSLSNHLSRLSPSQYRKIQNNRSLSRNLIQIGKALSDNSPPEVLAFIESYIDSIFAISDLPLEWLLIQDIPLAFLCDVCRVPETSSTSILSQFNVNCFQSFQINKDILRSTLVVCGATLEDPIFQTYQNQINLNRKEGVLPYKTAHIQSKEEFFRVVNEVRPHLLIIDSHGDFKKKEEGSYIWFGNEKVTGDDIVKHLPLIPLVILSCCWGTPIYGNSNTIAQAFFERGSFSVLSTFLPISVTSGFTLYFRIMGNLSYASKHRVHESWMNFISHNIRTSYLNDLFTPIFEKFGMDIINRENYTRLRLEWSLKCMHRKTRHSAYKEAKAIVVGCIKEEYKSRVERFLKSNEPVPEFMLYTHLGRGDLVKFSSWIEGRSS